MLGLRHRQRFVLPDQAVAAILRPFQSFAMAGEFGPVRGWAADATAIEVVTVEASDSASGCVRCGASMTFRANLARVRAGQVVAGPVVRSDGWKGYD